MYSVNLEEGLAPDLNLLTPSSNESLKAAVGSTFNENPTTLGYDLAKTKLANSGDKLPRADAELAIKNAGVKLKVPEDGYSKAALDIMIRRQQEQTKRQSVMDRTPWSWLGTPARGSAMLLTGITDPLNVASAFIPVVGEARVASMMAKAGGSAFARAGARAGIGGAEGIVGAAVLEPAVYGLHSQLQDDYGMTDSLINLGFGGLLGSSLHVTGGAGADAFRAWKMVDSASPEGREAAMRSAVADMSNGRMPDVNAVMAYDRSTVAQPDLGSALATRIASDRDGAVAEYSALEGTDGGRILNTDEARELSPGYRQDRTKSADVHEPASKFVKDLYAAKLAQPTPEGRQPLVLFTAGGTGAGKSSSLQTTVGKQMYEAAEMVYDTNMNTMDSAVKKIEQALAAGRQVAIQYTFRDPVDALVNGALPRAMRMGRTVPLFEHAKTHSGAYKTIAALRERYADDDRVAIVVVDNSRGRGKAAVAQFDELPTFNDTGLEETLYASLQNEHQAGRISDQVFSGTSSASLRPEGVGPVGSGAGGSQSAPADRAQEVTAAAARQQAPDSVALGSPQASKAADERLAEAPKDHAGEAAEVQLAEAMTRLADIQRSLELSGASPSKIASLVENLKTFDEAISDSVNIGKALVQNVLCGIRQ